jgi:protein arginine N-methyltransferase 1
MYSTADYWKMMTDHVRRDAYAAALRRAVRPDSVVVNIGTGVGVFALLACRFGARRVYAIEPDDIIAVAGELAAANGFTDRIEFIRAMSTDVDLPEPADVIVSDLRGVLPLQGPHIPTVRDAVARFLAPDGVLIPERDVIWLAPVDDPGLYRDLVAPWDGHPEGLEFDVARRHATGRWTKVRVAPDRLLGDPRRWVELDYRSVTDANVSGTVAWTSEREGTLHGVCAWFDATLVGDIGFSTAPTEPERIYGSGFFPLEAPVPVAVGDRIELRLDARLVGASYLWRWRTTVRRDGDAGDVVAAFDQSNLAAPPSGTHAHGDA